MRANVIQTNFTSGEVSPLMYGRVDVNKYANGARMLRNFIVRPQGGLCRRPGTKFIGSCKTAGYTRLMTFIVSNTIAYVLEFGNLYIRFYTNGGVVGGGTPVEVVTPYLSSELDQLYIAQSADELFIAHPNHPPQVLTRSDNITWSIATYVPSDGPYFDTDTTGNRMKLALVSDITTLNSNYSGSGSLTAITITASSSLFSSGSVGSYVFNPGTSTFQPLLLISAYISATVVNGNVIPATSYFNYVPPVIMTFSGGTISATVQPSGHSPNAYSAFNTSAVGLLIQSTVGVWYVITGYTSPSQVTATAITVLNSSGSVTLTITGNGAFSSGSVNQYVEYIVSGVYYLAKILTYVSATQVMVLVINQVFANEGEFNISIPSGSVGASVSITSSFSSVFALSDIGKFVRDTANQRWAQITAFTNSSTVTGILLNMFTYTYPVVTMSLQDNRVIIVTATALNPTFAITDVGTQVRLQFASQWRSLLITAVTSPTLVTGMLSDYLPYDLINAANTYNNGFADAFRLGAWSATNGFPAIVAFSDQRLIFANTSAQPSTLWFSQSADYYNMAPTEEDGSVIDTDAIYVTIASGNVDPITWVRAGQVLLVGTYSGEYEITEPGSGPISPTNIDISLQSSYGSLSPTVAFKFGVATLFLQRGGNKVREMLYQFQFNAFNSKDISIISEHILRIRSGSKICAYQVDPVSIFWIVCNNGDLVSCTYDRDQDVVAFAPHTVAGGTVESVVVVPNTTRDDVYLIVNRTINSATVRYIEMITPMFDTDTGDTLNTMQFLDCSQNYSGSPATTISGLSYLNGQVVYAIANGALVGPFTVASDSITLSAAASTVVVGLTYSSIMGSLSPEGASPTGTSQGKRKTIKEISARVKDALPFKHGPDLSHLTLIDAANFGSDLLPTVCQNQLITGDVRFSPDMAWDQQGTYYLVQDLPYPLTLVAVMPILNVNE